MKHYSISSDGGMAYEMTMKNGDVYIEMIGPGQSTTTTFSGREAKAMQQSIIQHSTHCSELEFEAHKRRIQNGSTKIEKR